MIGNVLYLSTPVQPGRRAECRHRHAAVGLRSESVRRRPAAERHRLRAPRRRRVARREERQAPHLSEQPLPADLPGRRDRTPRRVVRRPRHRRSQPRPRVGDHQDALLEHVAAGRLQGPRHPRQRRRRSAHLQARSARRRARIRCADGEAGVELPHDSAGGRIRHRHVGERLVEVHRPHEHLGADDARRRARPAVSAGHHAEQRFLRRPAPRREPLRRIARSASTRTPASANGTSRSSITACGTTTTRRRPTW